MQNNTFPTLFVGQNLIKLSSVDSTNNFLKTMLSNSEPLAEGTVIMADDQFAGRGQQDNIWYAEPGKNLTISILLKPNFLPVNKQFLLNMCISIAINNALLKLIPAEINIKWPNDIYYGNQKLGGVLIENAILGNVIKTAVIGIGLNVNQRDFDAKAGKAAISLHQILQRNVDLQSLLAEICSQVESLYLQLKAGNYTKLKEGYVSKLYRFKQKALYRQNGEIFEGEIQGVTDAGLLLVKTQQNIFEYNFKEIEFLNTT